eukprot:NODE_2606_length_1079_cov_16.324272_g2169_i0.p1 GENE.NODE_2606_length_1079_cov_16.324272_g2169_i0~~NODE_2606_length_1079_cov_16.324272_g2169_i0.p1  ORF type:complete len:296 (+),score=50.12 NODE_2606_length_1079_cov_16.324272_g2169_i0:104-991(+)
MSTPGPMLDPLDVPFVDSVSEDLQCGICLHAAKDACVTEECGHLFCKSCIVNALERRPECPVDRLPLRLIHIRKDVRAQRKINALQVYCYNKKHGCSWRGCLSDLERHGDRCEFATVKCPFAPHGCEAVVNRKGLSEHVSSNSTNHVLLLCAAVTSFREDLVSVQQELHLVQRDSPRFVWVIPNFDQKRGPVYSRKFFSRGLQWYLGVDFEGPDYHAGVYLFAEGHSKRVDFKLILFNADPSRDKVHTVADWALDFKGKGWGPLKFINRTNLEESGFVVNDAVRIGAELESEPFE